MPTILAAPLMNHPASLFSPTKSSNGTFAGGMGRGHWGFGNFNIDTTHAYLAGVYTSGAYIRLTGEIKNSNYDIIGEISATIIFKIIIGQTEDIQGQRTPLIAYVMKNKHDQFVGRLLISSFRTSPHIWGYLIPNT